MSHADGLVVFKHNYMEGSAAGDAPVFWAGTVVEEIFAGASGTLGEGIAAIMAKALSISAKPHPPADSRVFCIASLVIPLASCCFIYSSISFVIIAVVLFIISSVLIVA